MDDQYGPRNSRYHLRPRKPRTYSNLHNNNGTLATEQISMKKGLKQFGQDRIDAVRIELQQIHERDVVIPIHKRRLSRAELLKVLHYLMFLKRKRCGRVKGRGCTDGRKQRLYTKRADAAAPTASTEAVLLTSAIDAKEGRDVATVDIPGIFMQAFLVVKNNTPIINVQLKKALYGTIRAACLFYDLTWLMISSTNSTKNSGRRRQSPATEEKSTTTWV